MLPRKTKAATVLSGAWKVIFPEIGTVETDTLFSWPDSDDKAIRYFSGTAVYRKSITIPEEVMPDAPSERLILSLGEVRDMASVTVNGQRLPLAWKAPYECDITEAIRPGENRIEIAVTNLWRNRMIGDELEPDDLEWSAPLVYDFAPGKLLAGCFLMNQPDWLINGTEQPSKGRKTVGCFKFFRADSPLLPSGLLGPATLTLTAPL